MFIYWKEWISHSVLQKIINALEYRTLAKEMFIIPNRAHPKLLPPLQPFCIGKLATSALHKSRIECCYSSKFAGFLYTYKDYQTPSTVLKFGVCSIWNYDHCILIQHKVIMQANKIHVNNNSVLHTLIHVFWCTNWQQAGTSVLMIFMNYANPLLCCAC